MTLAEFLRRRAAQPVPRHREICDLCRKAVPTCYCHVLRPFRAPAEFVILQHYEESRNAIATARMAHLSITNSTMIVGRAFEGDPTVNALIAAPGRTNVLLYPGRDAIPLDEVIAGNEACVTKPLVFWVLDAKWSQVPKMLRLSPNIRALPMAQFTPASASLFQIRRQPDPACVSTIEAIFSVIERLRPQTSEHHALLDAFRHLVDQQLGFVDVENDRRHRAAKARRRSRRLRKHQACFGE